MSELSFGIGRAHINPPMKMGLAGYFNTRIWENIHDPLEVRVVLLKSDDVTALCVQFELITVTPELFAKVRENAENMLDNPVILSGATHCHTAPELRKGRGGYDESHLHANRNEILFTDEQMKLNVDGCAISFGIRSIREKLDITFFSSFIKPIENAKII